MIKEEGKAQPSTQPIHGVLTKPTKPTARAPPPAIRRPVTQTGLTQARPKVAPTTSLRGTLTAGGKTVSRVLTPSRPGQSRPVPSRPVQSRPVQSRPVPSRPVQGRPVTSIPVEAPLPTGPMLEGVEDVLGRQVEEYDLGL